MYNDMAKDKKALKIIQVASGDLWAGAEVQLFHMVVALDKLPGVLVKVVLLNSGMLESRLKAEGIDVTVIDETQNSTLGIIRQLRSIVREYGAAIIHSHRFKENIVSGIVAKLTRCQSIRTIHGDVEQQSPGWNLRQGLIGMADRFVANYLQDKLVCVSSELVDKFRLSFKRDKLLAINNSVNPAYIQQMAAQAIDLPDTEGGFNIGFIGRFVEVKRVELFYQLAKRVIENDPDSKIHFYMLGDGPLFADIKSMVEAEQLESRIHLTGFVENSAPYLKRFDFLMFTSKHEGLPMTLLEAMVLKTPVISTNLASLKEVLDGERCGYFSDSEKPDALAQLVLKIIQDPALAECKAERAYQTLQAHYSIDTNASRYLSLYQELTSSSA